jgi:hypothetical protein
MVGGERLQVVVEEKDNGIQNGGAEAENWRHIP